jgi:hypothetical protein
MYEDAAVSALELNSFAIFAEYFGGFFPARATHWNRER